MPPTKEEIQKFIDRKCDATEAKQIAAYLLSHPVVLEHFFSEEEWDNADGGTLPSSLSEQMYEGIKAEINLKTKYYKLRWFSVAACVLAAVCMLYYFTRPSITLILADSSVPIKQAGTYRQITLHNTSAYERQYLLPDSSVIVLGSNSSVQYKYPWPNRHRDIYLNGTAMFSVRKKKGLPFSVHTPHHVTTALGTVFRVTSFPTSRLDSISLISGRIVVKGISDTVNAIYLVPGQSCTFDKAALKLHLNPSKQKKKVIIKEEAPLQSSSIKMNGDQVTFSNTPLTQVLQSLEQFYNVQISFNTGHLSGKKFTGRYFNYQTVGDVLAEVAALNGLIIKATDSTYHLSQHPNTKH